MDNSTNVPYMKRLLQMQQFQQLQLDDMQQQMTDIQQQLQSFKGLFDQLQQLNTIPIQLQNLVKMQKQTHRLLILSDTTEDSTSILPLDEPPTPSLSDEYPLSNIVAPPSLPQQQIRTNHASTATPNTRTTNNSVTGRTIPYPRTKIGTKNTKISRTNIGKDLVVNTIGEHLLPHVTIDFDELHIHESDETKRRLFVYRKLVERTISICSEESQQQYYDQLPDKTRDRLCKQLEKVALDDMIRIDLAENHWLSNYFVGCYFRNKREFVRKMKRGIVGRKRRRVEAVAAIQSASSPRLVSPATPESRSESPPASNSPSPSPSPTPVAKRPKNRRLPVVVSADQSDEYDTDASAN